jgi:hypothetical protein
MKKIKKIIFVALILPFLANANPLALDFFSGVMGIGFKAANERELQKKKLKNLKAITVSYTSCVTMNKIKKIKFGKQSQKILYGLKTIDQRVKYFEIYIRAQAGFANNLVQCSKSAEEALKR